LEPALSKSQAVSRQLVSANLLALHKTAGDPRPTKLERFL
jgi:hypothetical protein